MRRILTFLLAMVYFCQAQSQSLHIPGPTGSVLFGRSVTVLTNGNYVVTDPSYSSGGINNMGAAYLYNGNDHSLISTLTGSTLNNNVGNLGAVALPNGNFVIISSQWDNGIIANVGAVTWGSGVTGVSGIVSVTNSIIGTAANDGVGGGGVIVLPNGNYLIRSFLWDNGAVVNAGSVVWADGTTGLSGNINASNALIGSSTNDNIGSNGITVLPNSNYVVRSSMWDGAAANTGAVTWGNGLTGITGVVSSTNSLVGTSGGDNAGIQDITILGNNNYIVKTPSFNNGAVNDAGAVTWCSGTAGLTGVISSANSLVGSSASDQTGIVYVLTNNNYVVTTGGWDNGALANAGAVTWCDGATGRTGLVTLANSLTGAGADNLVGAQVTILSNGNYVVRSPQWDNGAIVDVGAATLCNGATGTTGTVSIANSLIGSTTQDRIAGTGVALTNGGYVIGSSSWDNGPVDRAGAATWAGPAGITGFITPSNSLVGSNTDDRVSLSEITALNNGNYVVSSSMWNNGAIFGAGAVTFGDGTTGITGTVTSSNSLVGSTISDGVGTVVFPLTNNNYVVVSELWNNGAVVNAGAVTWGSGISGVSGTVTSSNSLVGSSLGDLIGNTGITALSNGNYIVRSQEWNNGAIADAGAVTLGNGSTGTTGPISNLNSLTGSSSGDYVGVNVTLLTDGNFVVNTPSWSNGSATSAGAITWVSAVTGKVGSVSSANSVTGSKISDEVGNNITALSNGYYAAQNNNWDNGQINNTGSITFGNSATMGIVSSCNSVLANTANGGVNLRFAYNNTYNYYIAGRSNDNIITIYQPDAMTLAVSLDTAKVNISSSTPTPLIVLGQCRVIANLSSTGANPVNGTVNAKVWIESPVPTFGGDAFVARHFEINPVVTPTTATGSITLYFTQAEFDDFNAHPLSALDLPSGPSDAIGIANLRVAKYSGTSTDNTGLPGSYVSAPEIIDPADADIIWNASLSRWEVSFDVTGFGGFIVQTRTTALPLQLLKFNAVLSGKDVKVTWKTTNEINTSHFEIERSSDGLNFIKIGVVAAVNASGVHQYNFTDLGAASLPGDKLFYRLKQVDIDNRYIHSDIVLVQMREINVLLVYPTPAKNFVNLAYKSAVTGSSVVTIINQVGAVVISKTFYVTAGDNIKSLDVAKLPDGMYFIKVQTGDVVRIGKLIRQ